MLNLNDEEATKIKNRQGFVKGDDHCCIHCFNLAKDEETGKLYCGLGSFPVKEQDTCKEWISKDGS